MFGHPLPFPGLAKGSVQPGAAVPAHIHGQAQLMLAGAGRGHQQRCHPLAAVSDLALVDGPLGAIASEAGDSHQGMAFLAGRHEQRFQGAGRFPAHQDFSVGGLHIGLFQVRRHIVLGQAESAVHQVEVAPQAGLIHQSGQTMLAQGQAHQEQ